MLLPYLNENLIEAGCDEAGRGCLAGAVYAAAVILPKDFKNELLNDSKQLTEKQRYALREVIEKEAIAWAVGIVSPEEIDEINTTKKRYGDLIEYYENKQWDKFYDSYLNELNSQKKVIQQTQEISEKDTNKNEYLEMIEATDKQMNIINHYRKNHLNYENTDYPIY